MPEIEKFFLEPPAGFACGEAGRTMTQLDHLHRRLAEGTRGSTPSELEWQPAAGANSIGMLLAHIAIAEVYWAQVGPLSLSEYRFEEILGVGDEDDGMPLAEGGRPPAVLAGKDLAFYDEVLARGRAFTRKALERLSASDLDRIISRRRGEKVQELDMRWILFHMVEHLSGHAAQVMQLRHLRRIAVGRPA
jgi:uncharacterized damage-inducible protein DinB